MFIRHTKRITIAIVLVIILSFFFGFRLFTSDHDISSRSSFLSRSNQSKLLINKKANKHFNTLVTVVLREFEPNENDVTATVNSILKISHNIKIYILFDKLPYPPLNISSNNSNIILWNLTPSLGRSFHNIHPLLHIQTKYVLFIPDASRLLSKQSIQKLLNKASKNTGSIWVSPVSRTEELKCYRLNVSIKEWSLHYNLVKKTYCDAVNGKHIILLETDTLKNLSNPFLLPFPASLYIQTSVLNIKVFILKTGLIDEANSLLKTHHAKWKFGQVIQDRLKQLYSIFGMKLVVKDGRTEWYGCNRDTPRCFEEVVNASPSYLVENKWTPPCCLAHLRRTAKYVLNILDQFGIRYWLEAGSLLSAVRGGDILPWAYTVDIGYMNDDGVRCKWLKLAQNRSIIDDNGFFWEKVKEGNHYRINFSKVNRVFVNLFPFFHKNNTMTRDLFLDKKRNMEFADYFLHPMSSIEFIGNNVPCPNDVRRFLELKYGEGILEHSKYST